MRIRRTKNDLLNELHEQIQILVCACNSFDRGLRPVGKHIALSLRVLLHHHGRSRSLLEQLDLRNKRFLDTAGDINPNNLTTDWKLCVMKYQGSRSEFLPQCMVAPLMDHYRWLPFEKWWNQDVVKDEKSRRFNRRELILNVADTDGGAHVDPELDEKYLDLSRNNSLGWSFSADGTEKPFPTPVYACIRQIAHELLETLKIKAKDVLAFDYEAFDETKKHKPNNELHATSEAGA